MKMSFPVRGINSHKGLCGRIGIVAGSDSMLGAAVLAARAAMRAGAGLVYVLTVESAAGSVNVQYPELIVRPLPTINGCLANGAQWEVEKTVQEHHLDCLAIGPGLGQQPETQAVIRKILENTRIPLVVDADALNAVHQADIKKWAPNQCVLTPHPGEYQKLFGLKHNSDADQRAKEVLDIASTHHQVVVLKGYQTIVADNQTTYINQTGNPGMATAGTGDVLTGVIASLIGQGLGLFEAAKLGVYIHGLAGDLAFNEYHYGLIASDIIEKLPHVIKRLAT